MLLSVFENPPGSTMFLSELSIKSTVCRSVVSLKRIGAGLTIEIRDEKVNES